MNNNLSYINEPKLIFGYDQKIEDPRDGILLFGPNETFEKHSIEAGVIGTPTGISLYNEFVRKINKPLYSTEVKRPSFPGFEAVFNVKWNIEPAVKREIDNDIIYNELRSSPSKRVITVKAVNLYLNAIKDIIQNEESRPNIFFIIVPMIIYYKCRPGTKPDKYDSSIRNYVQSKNNNQLSLGYEEDEEYHRVMEELIDATSDFHHLLKAKLIHERIETPIQIVLEATLSFRDKRRIPYSANMQAFLAWSLATTTYYKLGKVPWKLGDIRPKVCYLGLVFKQLRTYSNTNQICSAAQMFLDSGDGSIFKGTVDNFKTEYGEYHLTKQAAKKLLLLALEYYEKDYGDVPDELFIHGRAKFTNSEWEGFQDAIKEKNISTKIVGIVIKERSEKLKLFRDAINERCEYGNLRGLALKTGDKEGFLWTKGFVPRLNTSIHKEIANPLRIIVDKGEVDVEVAFADILALTKLNYNACLYGDGLPVTLRFSESIGKILTAIPDFETKIRQFRYYI